MKGSDVARGLLNVRGSLNMEGELSLYQKECVEYYQQCVDVAIHHFLQNYENEVGGFYDDSVIVRSVERALGIRLTLWQRNYILGIDHTIPDARGCGKTFAYQLRLILDTHRNFDLTDPDVRIMISDDGDSQVAGNIAASKFIELHRKLKNAGIPVCQIDEV